MSRILKICLLLVIGVVALIIGHVVYLKYLFQADAYPMDRLLEKQTNKTALIIVAHDDDAIGMSGTIAFLCKHGWEVRELCFYQGWKNKDSIRKRDLERVATLLGMKSVEYHDIELRKDREKVEKPWLPIPYADFEGAYNRDTALHYISKLIEEVHPSIIFTLDDILGGYGHPDHVFISRLINDYCRTSATGSSFSVNAIYQAVFDPAMNERILKDMDAFQLAKKVYGVNHSPRPDVYVPVEGCEALKKEAMLAYTTEQNSLTKIWPFYSYYPAKVYFGIFDQEYYRVLKKEDRYQNDPG